MLPDAEAVEWRFKYSYPTGSDENISGVNKGAILCSLGFRPSHISHFVLCLEGIVQSRSQVYANCVQDVLTAYCTPNRALNTLQMSCLKHNESLLTVKVLSFSMES